MTIHAGEKAARLRRATTSPLVAACSVNASSSTIALKNSIATSSSENSVHTIATPVQASPVLNRHTGQKQARSHQSLGSKARPSLVKGKNKSRDGQRQAQSPSSTSTQQAASNHFVFSGIDAPPVTETDLTTLNWDTLNIQPQTSIEDVLNSSSASPPLIFVQQRPKESERPASTTSFNEAVEGTPTTATDVSSNNPASSPRHYLPWLFTLASSSSRSKERAEPEESAPTNGVAALPDKVAAPKKSRHKRKSLKRVTMSKEIERAKDSETSITSACVLPITDTLRDFTAKENGLAEALSISYEKTGGPSSADSIATSQAEAKASPPFQNSSE
ncbi:hypothetical protein CBS101457_005244 [Exobasidium rhododendri]|nr:hypothetical protein CBS101457_005244 [Exobasidium rhododendri]